MPKLRPNLSEEMDDLRLEYKIPIVVFWKKITYLKDGIHKSDMVLEEEQKTFEREKSQLLKSSRDKFVLIKGDKIVGTFDKYEDALAKGYELYGNEDFLVKQITEVEPINFFSREILA